MPPEEYGTQEIRKKQKDGAIVIAGSEPVPVFLISTSVFQSFLKR